MAEYLNKEVFLQSMGLAGDETKYGNRDGEHQSRSYSTWMGYETMDSVECSIARKMLWKLCGVRIADGLTKQATITHTKKICPCIWGGVKSGEGGHRLVPSVPTEKGDRKNEPVQKEACCC